MNKKQLDKYSKLLIKIGVNLQKGEMLVISAPILAQDLVRSAVKQAYKCGASNVDVLWSDDEILKLGYRYRSKKNLADVPEWITMQREHYIDKKVCYLAISASDPEVFKGINSEKLAISRRANGKALKKFREHTSSNKIRWAIASYPNKAWAKKMFPDMPSNLGVKRLWEYISKTVRLDTEDPILA